MTRTEFLSRLNNALSCLPEDEKINALRYYEEYLDDAGPEKEVDAIEGLGEPEKIAEQLLEDYTELSKPLYEEPKQETAYEYGNTAETQTHKAGRRNGISPAMLILLLVLAVPVGIPVVATLAALVIAALAVAAAVALVAAALPLCMIVAGIALTLFSFFTWFSPASALVTLGSGLGLIGAGVLLGLLVVKICVLFVPPLFKWFVWLLRWPLKKMGVVS